jgi:uncharacterized protein
MPAVDVAHLQTVVLWAAFGASVLFGFIAQRTQFCTMGAVSDIVNMGSWTRMRMWAMAVGVATLGYHGLGWLGFIDTGASFYVSGRIPWLSALFGGALFGFGMVLASGCGSKTLMRIGGGSLKAMVVFVVMGFFAFATLRGVLAVARVNVLDPVAFDITSGGALPQWLSHATGLAATDAGLLAAGGVGGALVLWALRAEGWRETPQVLGGAGLGLMVVLMWWISGHLGFVAEHPDTLEPTYLASSSGSMESLTFTAPIANLIDWLVYFSDRSRGLSMGIVSVLGVLVGAHLQARVAGSFRWEGFRSTQDTALHLVGAALMGVGGVTALGCTVGQGLSGLSTLSLTSVIAVAAIMVGARLGIALQVWLLERE